MLLIASIKKFDHIIFVSESFVWLKMILAIDQIVIPKAVRI